MSTVSPPLIVEPRDQARAAVIFLHGLGADGSDFADFPARLGLSGVRYLFPHAPVRAVTLNAGARMRAWFDIARLGPGSGIDTAGLEESVATVDALLRAVGERGVPVEKTILGGFSQGGAVALYAALTRGWPLAGVVALSTFLPAGLPRPSGARPVAVFLAHGRADPVVDVRLGVATRDALLRSGHEVRWWTHEDGHAVDGEEIRAIAAWMAERFAADDGEERRGTP